MTTVTPHARSEQRLRELGERISQRADFVSCCERLRSGAATSFDEVWGSACALLVGALHRHFPRIVLVTSDQKAQDDLYDDLSTFISGTLARLPTCSTGIGQTVVVDQEYGDRLRLLKQILSGDQPNVIVTAVQGILQPVPSRSAVGSHSRIFRVGDRIDVKEFPAWLKSHGFHQTTAVELAGEFSIRGGIVDLFAPDWLLPVRLELFDDEIESIRQFELGTQRSTADVGQIEITVLSPDFKERAHFWDYLASETLVLQVEPQELHQQAEQYLQRVQRRADFFELAEAARNWAKFPVATIERLAVGVLENQWRMGSESIEDFGGDVAELRKELDRIGSGQSVHVVARVDGELERITELLSPTRVAANGNLNLSVGCVHRAFRLRKDEVVVIGCDQMFRRGELRRGKARRFGKAIDSFLSLREGDLIVHLAHGIGRFRGLKMLQKDGQLTEHLELEFHGGTRIYVPASKIDLVQKYIGGAKTRPVLAKIGGKAWAKQRQAAERAVADMATDMLELQAIRAASPGIAFKQDTHWQHEFEQAFPYRETNDQLTSISAIKEDMQTAKPMDRLLCGDVGFGKTEVAMRAAFKAVENGYQVAVLVPTTILAEQHFKTFRERMSEFPLSIGRLSRFAPPQEQRDTLEGLKKGKIDIVIGTHRVVSKDVDFFNLGLVIIDEEQRFGVAHKDRLKSLRETVDVLTLSATPIPRTLHMSLVGVRDISNLETPPEERMAVETRVTRFNEELIRNAILREINRGGQVYFVHNRVQDILLLRDRLKRIVPEATIGVGHGQMPEDELEDVMTEFVQAKYDVLLATTIIESGLDIPNANTIFIDEANRYGLSDLHQLRGRVGRYKNQAFCYLLLDPNQAITPNAAKRLQAIETFSEMGAGFSIAMRDLEIRGAGNLLGTEQSGHIAAVGYELYCQLLETAVRQMKRMPQKIASDVDVDLPIEAYLPDEYIPDRRQKIDLYRRLTRIEAFGQIGEIQAEMLDRFGPLPEPVQRLLSMIEVKLEASIWQVSTVFLEDKFLGFKFSDLARFQQLAAQHRGVVRIVDDRTAYVSLKSGVVEPGKLLALVKAILRGGK
jgi:transcription-repair coupling factor (superfamily II helicase)